MDEDKKVVVNLAPGQEKATVHIIESVQQLKDEYNFHYTGFKYTAGSSKAIIDLLRYFNKGKGAADLHTVIFYDEKHIQVIVDESVKDKPQEYFEDPADYMQVCLRLKKCAVCGRPGEEHHYDAVGMGRNRQAINDEGMLKMSLCRLHHTECHTIGKQKFCEKYHLQPVLSVPQRQ